MPGGLSVRTLVAAVYLPSVIYSVGQGAILPVVALSARALGASVGVAGLVVALVGIGQICADLPGGALAARVGERNAMVAASAVAAVALVACLLARSLWLLAPAIFVTGMSGAVWQLARQSYLTEVVPVAVRGRAMSTLGGMQRVGMFIGPFVGAGVMHFVGMSGAYAVHLVAAVTATVALLLVPDVGRHHRAVGAGSTPSVVRRYWPVLRTLGLAVLLVSAVRASRQVVVPLWAEHVGLDATTISLVYGVSGAVDMLLFYPAGKVMDRYGRTWVAVPSMVVLGASHLLLPLTHAAGTLLAVAILMGFGNGMGAGVVLTLGADVAPAEGRPAFLGAFRLAADSGTAAGPAIVSAVSAATALAPAVVAMGAVAALAVAALRLWIPRQVRGRT
ncbi:MAG: MFS transporter [Streptosporangiales bacterium]|nr:MFS transporter [Streptosporangiales bacterium]MBO0892214.1 MFS transporter [Acidothermales bacterium]